MLKELRAAHRAKTEALAATQPKAFAEGATAEDLTAFKGALAEVDALSEKIELAVRADAAVKAVSRPASDPSEAEQERIAVSHAKRVLTPTEKIGSVLVAMTKSFVLDGDRSSRGILAKMEEDGYGHFANELSFAQKTMNTTTGATGGFAVPPDFRQEILPLLTPYTAFLRGNPTIVEMPAGNFRQSAGATRPTWSYKAENTDTAASTATLRDIDMSAKILTGMIPITNQVARWTSGRAQAFAVNALAVSGGLAVDSFMLRGDGTGANVLGILNKPSIGTRAATAGSAPTAVVVDADLRKMLNPIESFSELQIGLAWVMAQRTLGYLTDLRTPAGENYAYPTLQGDNPTLKGYPVLKTAAVPINLGAGTNESQIALVSFSNVLMGETQGMTLSISDSAAYVTGGTTISAYQRDLILIKANMEHDNELVYNEAVQMLTAVTWGA